MHRIPAIKGAMTPFPYSIDRDAGLEEARVMMADHNIRHLPVTAGGELVGVVAACDVGFSPAGRFWQPPVGLTVADVCAAPYAVDLDARLDNVLLHMADHHIDAAVVLREGRLVGIFTGTDACRRYGEALRRDIPESGDDAA